MSSFEAFGSILGRMDASTPSGETQEIDLRRAAYQYLDSEDQISKVHRSAPSRADTKNQEVLSQYSAEIKAARRQSILALRNLIRTQRSCPLAPPEVRFAITDFLFAYRLLSDIATDTARQRVARARTHLEVVLATPTPTPPPPINAGAYYQALTDEMLQSFDSIPDDDTDDLDDAMSRASRL